MNWKTTVSKLNAKHYAFPAGWDDRDTIASQLDCSPDRVDTLLAPGLKSGEIEKQQFPVWDSRLGRKTLVWGYRQRPAKPDAPNAQSLPGIPADLLPKVREKIAKHPEKTAGSIRDLFSNRNRQRLSTAAIRALLTR